MSSPSQSPGPQKRYLKSDIYIREPWGGKGESDSWEDESQYPWKAPCRLDDMLSTLLPDTFEDAPKRGILNKADEDTEDGTVVADTPFWPTVDAEKQLDRAMSFLLEVSKDLVDRDLASLLRQARNTIAKLHRCIPQAEDKEKCWRYPKVQRLAVPNNKIRQDTRNSRRRRSRRCFSSGQS